MRSHARVEAARYGPYSKRIVLLKAIGEFDAAGRHHLCLFGLASGSQSCAVRRQLARRRSCHAGLQLSSSWGFHLASNACTRRSRSSEPAVEVTSQETRAERIRQEQADKLRTVTPPELSGAEKIVHRLEDWGWLTGEPRGVYPVLDSVYPGGGFAAGLGARKPFGDDGAISVIGAYSINNFWRAQTEVSMPSFASNRGRVSLRAGYLDAPDVKYYGIGQDSDKDDKTSFGYTPFGGGGRLDFDVSRYVSVGGGVNYIDIETGSGASGPSIEQRFSHADSPGLELDQFKYVNSTARAVVDWRRQLGYAGAGGLYRVQFDDFRETDSDQYSFRSLKLAIPRRCRRV